ncbi:FtsX-like permease family protein [Chryseobacterium gotjawalense]|uniref:FtsX-like permease family protein n=1 Tax=Chryseobacterium gotjawalense TaxID=3042315 RepID=A0ABY8REU8_9FLAO|nr:FtsX-like permease family protein [Chryseobacterium sp. wdc7]WHF52496.1 FtsX-like permease family protein [Chryseobacterium sp. wdc7]
MILTMAWRNLWRNRSRSVIIIISIALGLLAGISAMALYKGMTKSRIRTVVYSEVGHLQLHAPAFKKEEEPQFFLANGPAKLKEITGLPEVKYAAPRSVTNGMLTTPGGSAGVKIYGVIPALEYKISKLNEKVVAGNLFRTGRKNQIWIGKKLADKMKLKAGAKLVLTFTDTSGEIVSGAFRVAAVYQTDNAPRDEKNVYVEMKDLNAMLGLNNKFHEIAVLLKDDDAVTQIQKQLRQTYPDAEVESWIDLAPELNLLVKTTHQYSYIIMAVIMLALAFGIINTMLMAVLERTREIGMMMALGMQRVRIFTLVVLETFILTAIGAPVGLLAGWVIIQYFNRHGLDLSTMGTEMMRSFGFSTMVYPEFPTEKLAGIIIIIFVTAIIACLFPSVKAVMLKPVDALKR